MVPAELRRIIYKAFLNHKGCDNEYIYDRVVERCARRIEKKLKEKRGERNEMV